MLVLPGWVPKPRRVTKVVRCFDEAHQSPTRQGGGIQDWWLPGQSNGWYGAGMEPPLETRGRSNEAHTKQEGSKQAALLPFPPFQRLHPSPSSSCSQPFYWARLPALPSLHYPPPPLVLELVPLFTSSNLSTFPNLSIHPSTSDHFFHFEKQSVKMGYTKTDELAINTIRVLAVSQISSQAFLTPHSQQRPALPLHRRCRRRRHTTVEQLVSS